MTFDEYFSRGVPKVNAPNVFKTSDGQYVNDQDQPLRVINNSLSDDPAMWTYQDELGKIYTPKSHSQQPVVQNMTEDEVQRASARKDYKDKMNAWADRFNTAGNVLMDVAGFIPVGGGAPIASNFIKDTGKYAFKKIGAPVMLKKRISGMMDGTMKSLPSEYANVATHTVPEYKQMYIQDPKNITKVNRMQFDTPTAAFYNGPTYSYKELFKYPDESLLPNVSKIRQIEKSVLKHLPGGTSSIHRAENPQYHILDRNTFQHTKKAYMDFLRANYTDYDEVFDKNKIDTAAGVLLHDAGKLYAGDGHGEYGASLAKQVFPDLPDHVADAIYSHMYPKFKPPVKPDTMKNRVRVNFGKNAYEEIKQADIGYGEDNPLLIKPFMKLDDVAKASFEWQSENAKRAGTKFVFPRIYDIDDYMALAGRRASPYADGIFNKRIPNRIFVDPYSSDKMSTAVHETNHSYQNFVDKQINDASSQHGLDRSKQVFDMLEPYGRINLVEDAYPTHFSSPLDPDSKLPSEKGSVNAEFRYLIYNKLYKKLGRVPTRQEFETYIDTETPSIGSLVREKTLQTLSRSPYMTDYLDNWNAKPSLKGVQNLGKALKYGFSLTPPAIMTLKTNEN